LQTFFHTQAFIEDIVGIVDFAAAGAGQVATEKRLKHQHQWVFFIALQFLFEQIIRHCYLLS
jgi:hypothetical protein